jgi:hypothetical protein
VFFLLPQHRLYISKRIFFSIFFLKRIVSPSAKIATWRYWFHLSRDVYVGNRSFASYTKTKTVESAVCLLTQLDDGDSQQVNRIEIPEHGSGLKIDLFLLTTTKRIE